jgi:hypothetical protein
LAGLGQISGPISETVMSEIKTPEGQRYATLIQAKFEDKYHDLLSDCRANVKDDLRGFYFFFRQDADGKATGAFAYPATALNACFSKTALSEKPTFIAPPQGDYWNRIVVRSN